MRGLSVYSTFVSRSSRCTVAKCSSQLTHSESRIDGASWVAAMQPGSLQSSALSGLRSMRRRQLAHKDSSHALRNAKSFSRYCDLHSEAPRELIWIIGSAKPTAEKKS